MAKKKSKPLTDEEFISSVLPRLHKKDGHWILYGEFEGGRHNQFEMDARRLISICKANGGSGEYLERHGWWLYYEHLTYAMRDRYRNYSIFDIGGAFARHLEALVTRRGH